MVLPFWTCMVTGKSVFTLLGMQDLAVSRGLTSASWNQDTGLEKLFHLPWCKGPSRVLWDILSCSSRCAWGAEPGQDSCSSNFRLSFKDLWCIPILLQLKVIKFISKSSPGEHITLIVPTIIILKAAELQGLNSESFPHQNYMKTGFFFFNSEQ